MPEYTYTFYDARTRTKLGALPLYGVSCTDTLVQGKSGSRAGTFTGSIRMDSDFATVQEILDITREGNVIWMDRNGTPIWCGINWTRTYQSDGRVMQLNAQSFSSYLSKVIWDPFDGTEIYSLAEAAHNVIRYLYQYLEHEADPEYALGIQFEDYHQEVTNPFMSVQFLGSDRKFLSSYEDDALKIGAEYRIVPMLDEDGNRVAQLQTGEPGSLGVTQSAADLGSPYQYPGDISKYWLTNSMLNAPTKFAGVGSTQGQNDILYVKELDTENPPRLGVDRVESYNTSDATELQAFVTADMNAAQTELYRPVYELNGGNVDLSWGLGDYKRIVIDDPYRFPDAPVGGAVRLVGWTLTPAGSDNTEQQSIVIDEVTNLVPLNV